MLAKHLPAPRIEPAGAEFDHKSPCLTSLGVESLFTPLMTECMFASQVRTGCTISLSAAGIWNARYHRIDSLVLLYSGLIVSAQFQSNVRGVHISPNKSW